MCRGNVGEVLKQKDQRQQMKHLLDALELNQVCDRDVEHLSGLHMHPSATVQPLNDNNMSYIASSMSLMISAYAYSTYRYLLS